MGPRGGLRERGNKLHHFVIGDGADEEYQTALMRQDDTEDHIDAVPAGQLEKPPREDVAENMRFSMPRPRLSASHIRNHSLASQAHSGSPVRSRHASPRPSASHTGPTDRFNGLFTGSVLGDEFMRSEASTPHPEFDDHDDQTIPARRQDIVTQKAPGRWSSSRQEPLEESVKFATTDEGFMGVVHGGKKYTPTALRDGFTKEKYYTADKENHYEDDKGLLVTAAERHPGLPIRTEPRRLTKAKEERVLYSARAASPAYEPPQWTSKRHHERRRSPEKDVESVQHPPSEPSEDEVRVTPRAKKHVPDVYPGSVTAEDPTQYTTRDTSRARKRHRENPDYDDQALSNMSYKNLRDESFDFDPTKAALAGVTIEGTLDLPTKLEQRRHRGEEEQRQFFAGMQMKEWEESGDWFVDQFAMLMKKMRDARREKRQVIESFEEEAERREEVVRARSEAIDRKLGKMRQDGMKVVGDGTC